MYPNAYIPRTGSGGVLLTDAKGNPIVGDKFLGWMNPTTYASDNVISNVPGNTFDATSIRISEIILGYTFNKNIFGKKSFVKGAYVAFTGRNIWQIYQKTPLGIDPESVEILSLDVYACDNCSFWCKSSMMDIDELGTMFCPACVIEEDYYAYQN